MQIPVPRSMRNLVFQMLCCFDGNRNLSTSSPGQLREGYSV